MADAAGGTFMLTLTAPGDRAHRLPSGELCSCTPEGGVDLAQWNGESVHRWNRFLTDLRRSWASVEYFRATEVQDRGAIHFHILIRVENGQLPGTAGLRKLAVHHGFGHAVDLKVVDSAGRAAGYVAKYVSKACGSRELVPFVHRQTGEIGAGKWRTWTASRNWGETMRSVRERQRAWWELPPEVREEIRAQQAERSGAGAGGAGPLDPNGLSYATGPPAF